MCVAATLVASTLLQAQGQLQAGQQNAAIANRNADRLDTAATDAVLRGRAEADLLRQQVVSRIGTQRAGLSASNVDISRGSAARLSADTAAAGELEVMTILNNAAREAYGMRQQASIVRDDGRAARRAGTMNAAGTLITGTSQVYGVRKRPG